MLFSLISFYWASGGMLGVKTLGGIMYQKALEREDSFIAIVWITGLIKLAGGFFLLLLLRKWSKLVNRTLYFIALIGGILLFLYGLVNFGTIFLSVTGYISLQIENFAAMWRLFFWEPFWMLGGALFILSAFKFSK
ncbi:DUF3995 domain-containing protein [Bacillus sp. FJAT-49736]|nr:DUF3995 domain-containing protein [Bacillus sp. FJAT-49736]MBS4172672.1 DUF3995 domain-containing protein [Bacillus sp. FJAT-49736]